MKSLFSILLLTLFTVSLTAQKISHQVLLPAAGVVTAGDISYQQTIGETAVEIFTVYPSTLTQGFQQPSITLPDNPDPTASGIQVYPNPVSSDCQNKLTIKLISTEARSYNVIIFNFAGTIVYTWQSGLIMDEGYDKMVEMDRYSRGIYFVRVRSTDGVIDLTHKIEKL